MSRTYHHQKPRTYRRVSVKLRADARTRAAAQDFYVAVQDATTKDPKAGR